MFTHVFPQFFSFNYNQFVIISIISFSGSSEWSCESRLTSTFTIRRICIVILLGVHTMQFHAKVIETWISRLWKIYHCPHPVWELHTCLSLFFLCVFKARGTLTNQVVPISPSIYISSLSFSFFSLLILFLLF